MVLLLLLLVLLLSLPCSHTAALYLTAFNRLLLYFEVHQA